MKPRAEFAVLKFHLLAACVIVIGFGCSGNRTIPSGPILSQANRVEVFRVGPEPAAAGVANTIGGYPILAEGKTQGQDFAERLSKILLSEGVTQNRKKCGLQPGVAYRMWNGDKAVEVLVCFSCDVLWPHVVGEPYVNVAFEYKDFDPVRADLLKLTREAFPDDDEIQKLKEKRNP